MPEEPESMTYIARCKCGCGAIRFAIVDNPSRRRDIANECAKMMRKGYAIERMTTAEVRTSNWACAAEKAERETKATAPKAPKPPRLQESLF